jgi:hypothetical protein
MNKSSGHYHLSARLRATFKHRVVRAVRRYRRLSWLATNVISMKTEDIVERSTLWEVQLSWLPVVI